ncbi:tetratricopeptide repeat protein [Intestinibacter sp.]|uniref:tetratricopeptide repeat protein n=1 Tax=Intestinibacter sp. TaxID=1965304 RepID=UPI002A74E71A|nr:tetratricopeptide repeat protein [Intestinibacter sp.]MDY2735856.1 tetratricopeptide repeat protein [Intestinibacter sp.]
MPRKIMDISLVEENKSDYTFFKIDEDENEDNDTLKALKQTYVTSNYKNETILNLQKELNTNSTEISKEIKLESYNKYNNALDLANRHYITKAVEFVEEALRLNPKDPDILNLKGLLYLLKCEFSKSFESFYTSQCYGNNELSRKYVTLLSSKDFKTFLERYNHSIRFINEELNEESIEIFDSLILEEPELIEPYVISILLYDRVGDEKKKISLLEDLRCIDKDNPIFEKFDENGEVYTNTAQEKQDVKKEDKKENTEISKTKSNKNNKKDKKHFVLYAVIALLIVVMGAFYLNNQRKIEDLNNQISSKDEEIDQKDKELSEKEEELTQKEEEEKKAKEEEEKAKEEAKQEEQIIKKGAESLYFTANDYKMAGDYEEAIKYYKYTLKATDTNQFRADAIYNLGLSYQKLGDDEKAEEYYKRFVNTYSASEEYYDDAFYHLGVLYYKDGRLQDAKDAFYTLRAEDPSSPYNSSNEVKNILSK